MSHGYAGCREAGRRDAPGLHRGWLLSLPLVPASGSVLAEGTRTLHPAGAPGERDGMDVGNPSSIHPLIRGAVLTVAREFPSARPRGNSGYPTHSIARTTRWSDAQRGAGVQGVSNREDCDRQRDFLCHRPEQTRGPGVAVAPIGIAADTTRLRPRNRDSGFPRRSARMPPLVPSVRVHASGCRRCSRRGRDELKISPGRLQCR